jgi:hypothetical protein
VTAEEWDPKWDEMDEVALLQAIERAGYRLRLALGRGPQTPDTTADDLARHLAPGAARFSRICSLKACAISASSKRCSGAV